MTTTLVQPKDKDIRSPDAKLETTSSHPPMPTDAIMVEPTLLSMSL